MPVHGGRYRSVFSERQLQELKLYLTQIDRQFFGMTKKQCRRLVFDYAENLGTDHPFNKETRMAGEDWLANFMKTFKFSMRKPEATSIARAMGFNRVQVSKFFDVLRNVREKHNFSACNIYNADESGLTTVPNKLPKVISPIGAKRVSKIVTAERGKTITIICCMNANGNYLPPFLIFPRKRMRPDLTDKAPPGTAGHCSDNGWVNAELFLEFLQHFTKHVNPSAEKPVLLLVDNHKSHISLNAINHCRDNHITMVGFPPHTTHKLQPLDVSFYGPLKTFFSQACDNFSVSNPFQPVTDRHIGELLSIAYFQAATVGNAVNGFRSTGIEPYNPLVFTDADFVPSETSERELEFDAEVNANNPDANVYDLPFDTAVMRTRTDFHSAVAIEDYRVQPEPPYLPEKSPENNETTVPLPGPSSKQDNIVKSSPSLFDLKPLPKSKRTLKKRQVNTATVLTSTPVKKRLIEEKEKREAKEKRKVERARSKNKVARKLRFGKKCVRETEDDVKCPVCDETYSDPPHEDWIQCSQCKMWWHENCSKYEGGKFVCDYC